MGIGYSTAKRIVKLFEKTGNYLSPSDQRRQQSIETHLNQSQIIQSTGQNIPLS